MIWVEVLTRDEKGAMPFSIIGSTEDVQTADGRTVKGREYLWGVAEGMFLPRSSASYESTNGLEMVVENEDHCDFKKLRALLIRTHMLDLIATSEESHYENYRQAQMETRKFGEPKVKKVENPKFKEEEEAVRPIFTNFRRCTDEVMDSSVRGSLNRSRWRKLVSGNGVSSLPLRLPSSRELTRTGS